MTPNRSFRASDLARAWVGYGTLDPRPYVRHYGFAEKVHDEYKDEAANEQARDLMDRLKFVSRRTGNIIVKGVIDGMRMIADYRVGGIRVSLLEFKTIWDHVTESTRELARFQLQLYIWIMKPKLEKRGFQLHQRHYVEIIDRGTSRLVERFAVEEDLDIEAKIWTVVAEYDGLATPPTREKEKCP